MIRKNKKIYTTYTFQRKNIHKEKLWPNLTVNHEMQFPKPLEYRQLYKHSTFLAIYPSTRPANFTKASSISTRFYRASGTFKELHDMLPCLAHFCQMQEQFHQQMHRFQFLTDKTEARSKFWNPTSRAHIWHWKMVDKVNVLTSRLVVRKGRKGVIGPQVICLKRVPVYLKVACLLAFWKKQLAK